MQPTSEEIMNKLMKNNAFKIKDKQLLYKHSKIKQLLFLKQPSTAVTYFCEIRL